MKYYGFLFQCSEPATSSIRNTTFGVYRRDVYNELDRITNFWYITNTVYVEFLCTKTKSMLLCTKEVIKLNGILKAAVNTCFNFSPASPSWNESKMLLGDINLIISCWGNGAWIGGAWELFKFAYRGNTTFGYVVL